MDQMTMSGATPDNGASTSLVITPDRSTLPAVENITFTSSGILPTRSFTTSSRGCEHYVTNGTPEETRQLGSLIPSGYYDEIYFTDEHIKRELALLPQRARCIRALRIAIYDYNQRLDASFFTPSSIKKVRLVHKSYHSPRHVSHRRPVEVNHGPLLEHLISCDISGRQVYEPSSLRLRRELNKVGIALEDVGLSIGERQLARGCKMDRWRCKPSRLRTVATIMSTEESEN
ncbi:hypothetical protein ACMFMF_002633 [Clarireedia jacksonii]